MFRFAVASMALFMGTQAYGQVIQTPFYGYCSRDMTPFIEAMGGEAEIVFEDKSREVGALLLKGPRGFSFFVVMPDGQTCLLWTAWDEEPESDGL